MGKLIGMFAGNESGATAIEYGLLAALLGVGVVAAASSLGGSLEGTFETLGDGMETQVDDTIGSV